MRLNKHPYHIVNLTHENGSVVFDGYDTNLRIWLKFLYYNVVLGFYLVVVYIELVGVYIHRVILRIVVQGAINFLDSDIVIDILDY